MEEGHDVCGGTLGVEFGFHEVHVGGNVGEVASIAFAEVVDRFALGGAGYAVFGTFAMAGEEPATLSALTRECVALICAEGELTRRRHHFDEGLFA